LRQPCLPSLKNEHRDKQYFFATSAILKLSPILEPGLVRNSAASAGPDALPVFGLRSRTPCRNAHQQHRVLSEPICDEVDWQIAAQARDDGKCKSRREAFADANFLLDNQNCEVPFSEEADF
jgi:hypothetical protein